MRPVFIGAIGLISNTLAEGRKLYVETFGLPLRQADGSNFLYSTRLGGGRYFGIWPLSEAAKACFGRPRWPAGRPVPQMFIEFEVACPADVAFAASELESKGHVLLHGPRTDPWGQTVARLQTREGLVIGISYVPWMHRRARSPARRARRRSQRSSTRARTRR